MGEVYPQLAERRALIEEITHQEEERFRRTLDRGLQLIADNDEWVERGGIRSLPRKGRVSPLRHVRVPDRSPTSHRARTRLRSRQKGFRPKSSKQARVRSQGSKVGSSAVADVYPSLSRKRSERSSFSGTDAESSAERSPGADRRCAVRWMNSLPGASGEIITRATPF